MVGFGPPELDPPPLPLGVDVTFGADGVEVGVVGVFDEGVDVGVLLGVEVGVVGVAVVVVEWCVVVVLFLSCGFFCFLT